VPIQHNDEKSLKNTKSAKATVARGKVLSVRVYPSEFGKERIAREETEGPPVEVFKKKIENEGDVNERTIHETGDGADYDEDALRKYQLERLRCATSLHIFGALFNKMFKGIIMQLLNVIPPKLPRTFTMNLKVLSLSVQQMCLISALCPMRWDLTRNTGEYCLTLL
jgi:hypothetical protein